jgi:hypothetical protein
LNEPYLSKEIDMTEPVWKMIYLARRNPQLSAEAFSQAWREHSALGRQCRNVGERVRSVMQCSRVLDATILPGAAQDYDGVNLMQLRDRESAAAIWSDAETLAIMRPDEPRVFSTYVRDFTLVCREQVLKDGPRGAIGLIGFLRRRVDLSPSGFHQACAAAVSGSQPMLGPLALATRIVYNEVAEPPPAGYAFDAIVECWFESLDALEQAFDPRDLRTQLPPAMGALLDLLGSVFMLTRVTHSRP